MLFSLRAPYLCGVVCCSVLGVAMSFGAGAQERALQEQRGIYNRTALLICNSKYAQTADAGRSNLPVLTNTCNDVDAIAGVLEQSGWKPKIDFVIVKDATFYDIWKAMAGFKDTYIDLEASGPTFGFFYYAGHGIQVRDDTYLFGVDATIDIPKSTHAIVEHHAGNMLPGTVQLFGELLSQIGDSGSGSIFVVIDSCRQTPIDEYVTQHPEITEQYYREAHTTYRRPVRGIRLLYSTAYGELSSDGNGADSPFALAFVQHLKEGGNIDLLIRKVVDTVTETTQFSRIKQIPDTTGSLRPPPPEDCLAKCGSKQ